MAACALLWSTQAAAQAAPPVCPADLATADIVDHGFSVSFCELCDVGTVRGVIENPYRRLDRMKAEIMAARDARNCCHELIVEPELHWRLGTPPSRPKEPGR